MFGRTSSMTANERFAVDMGRAAGNLPVKKIKPDADGVTGVSKKPMKMKPKTPKAQMKPGSGKSVMLSMMSKPGVKVNQNRPQSMGKTGTFNTNPRRA